MYFTSTYIYHQPADFPQMGLMDLRVLHLMFALITASHAQQPLLVSQPSSAEGTEGGSITLRCSYNSPSEIKVGSFRWVKEPGAEVRNTNREFMGRLSFTSEQGFLLERRADIEIRDLRHYDSGVYRCVVRIPGFQESSGNGTELRVVKEGVNGSNSTPQGDSMVLVWLLLRGILCTFGITTTALVTRLYYGKKKTSSLTLVMIVLECENEEGPCHISKWLLIGGAATLLLMLVVILILSICLCRVCRRGKKQKSVEGTAGNPDEASLHYAELQNLPGCNRGQCDGGSCPAPSATLNNDYATVAELKETASQGSCCGPEQNEEDGVDGGVSGDQSLVEVE